MSRTDPVISETTPGAKLRTEKARQGQNVSGMITVLVVSMVLVGIGFAVMLSFNARPDDKVGNAGPPAATEQVQQ
jgi:hypothetical protein